jgi:hypothetical protein
MNALRFSIVLMFSGRKEMGNIHVSLLSQTISLVFHCILGEHYSGYLQISED